MPSLEQGELQRFMVNAATPAIRKFIAKHPNETFFGFAVETLAEEGYFILCAGSVEAFRSVCETYREAGLSETEIQDEIRWNNQEWPHFDFALDCPLWAEAWLPAAKLISELKEHQSQLPSAAAHTFWEEFKATFRRASEDAFEEIMGSGVLDRMRRTDDFRAWVFEHHDVF